MIVLLQVKNDKIDEQMEQMAEKQSEVDKLKEELSIFQAQVRTSLFLHSRLVCISL